LNRGLGGRREKGPELRILNRDASFRLNFEPGRRGSLARRRQEKQPTLTGVEGKLEAGHVRAIIGDG
jgi:hypothetical protein